MWNAETYFKNIAETLKDIANSGGSNHFTKAESLAKMEGFLAEMQYAQGFQLVLMDSFRGQLIDRKSDNILTKRFITFFLLKNQADGTFSGKYQTVGSIKDVTDKIIGKMLHDRRNYQHDMHRLDPASVTYQQVGPIGSNWYGINVSFFMHDIGGNISYNTDDWLQGDPEPEPPEPQGPGNGDDPPPGG
jgi:hypothetical protein